MSRGKNGRPLSTKLRTAADGLDHLHLHTSRAQGHIPREPAGAPYSELMREAAVVVELYEEAERATFRRPGGLQVVPSAAWWDGQLFRVVPELEEPTDG